MATEVRRDVLKILSERTLDDDSLDIIGVLEEWVKLYDSGLSAEGNKGKLAGSLKLLTFLEEKLPLFHNWCARYLCEMSWEEKLLGWLSYAIQNKEEAFVDEQFKKYWKLFFRLDGDEADVITLDGIEFDISYKHYQVLRDRREVLTDLNHCTNEEILALHRDKECDGDFCCFICEEQHDRWRKEVKEQFESMNNIFINKKLGAVFIKIWINEVSHLKEEDRERIEFSWPPPRWHTFNFALAEYSTFISDSFELFDEFIQHILNIRTRLFYRYKQRPKVEFERVRDLTNCIQHFYGISKRDLLDMTLEVTNLDNQEYRANRMNRIYLMLSNFIQYAHYLIYLDKKFCNELIHIYSLLPDD